MAIPNAPLAPQSEAARCANHPESRAIATCTRCGNFICSQCYAVGADGNYDCSACDAKMPNMPLAERGDRFVANLVDSAVIFLPPFVSAFVGGILEGTFDHKYGHGSGGMFPGILMLLGGLMSLGVMGYQLYLVSNTGQTLGKRMRSIRVVRTDGSPASLGRILLLRNVVPGILGSLCGLVNLVDALLIFGEERRCLHDLLADTKVVQVIPETKDL